MVRVGAVLLFVGASGELVVGDRFRHFFEWDYPAHLGRGGEWMKVKIGRAAIVLGIVLLVIGAASEVLG